MKTMNILTIYEVYYLNPLTNDVTHLYIEITLPSVSKLIGLFSHLDEMTEEEFQHQIPSSIIERFHFLFEINVSF